MEQESILIDLHVHSEDSKYTGSNISKESDEEKLIILSNNYVRAVCFSDHDDFYLDSYLKRKKIIEKLNLDIELFPGLEVDLKRFDYKKGQAVFVFDPKSNLEKLKEITSKTFRHNRNKLNYKEAVELFRDFNFMVFPHAGKGSDNMDWEDIKDSKITALDVTDINNSNKKRILKQKKDIPMVYFSDTHTWSKYPQYSKYKTFVKSNPNFEDIKNNIENNNIERIKKC